MDEPTYTNSALSAYRRCPRLYELTYEQLLEPNETSEALSVGSTWHEAFEQVDYQSAIAHIRAKAPSPLWGEKLVRLYVAYAHHWAHQETDFEVTETESTFRVTSLLYTFEGQIDAKLQLPDGRRGNMERKTTSESVEPDSPYWERLRLNTQVGIYWLATSACDFTIYDVVRKPTINPKTLTKAERKKLEDQIDEERIVYCGEAFSPEEAASALLEGRETLSMYGARLARDIMERPGFYFARRQVDRTEVDLDALLSDIYDTSAMIRNSILCDSFPRNPDACSQFGTCKFFRLCSRNEHPKPTDPAPAGFHRRSHRHPELVKEDSTR